MADLPNPDARVPAKLLPGRPGKPSLTRVGGLMTTPKVTKEDTKAKAEALGYKQLEFRAMELIFDEGHDGDAAYLIMSGEVQIRRGVHSDNPEVLATLKQGEIFGEMALCINEKRSAAALATKPTRLIAISRDAFEKRLSTVDPVMRKIVILLTRRLKQTTSDFAAYKRGEHWQAPKKAK